jgi:splicing factor 3B subunit 2
VGAGDVEVTLLPEELEGLDEAAVKALYEEKAAEMRVRGCQGVRGGGVGKEGGARVGAAPYSISDPPYRSPTNRLPPPPQAAAKGEDFSDLVAAQAAVQKRKIQQRADAKAAKKSKGNTDFKF